MLHELVFIILAGPKIIQNAVTLMQSSSNIVYDMKEWTLLP